ncbi:MAG: hypothetical protein B0W54_03975 [Cellvibrio sp. 79]|nr:MAG: hypothetical protein B0W54_03975 [Cellvibrio sp. 79]
MNSAVFKKVISQMVAICGAAAVSSTQAASFDCTKASTSIEKLVCSSPTASNLDERLSAVYKTALEQATDKDSLKQQQRIWLKERRNSCKDETCIFNAYQARLVELNKMPIADDRVSLDANQEVGTVKNSFRKASATFVVPEKNRIENRKLPLTFKLAQGSSHLLCQPYVDMLNKTKYMEYPACERKLLPEFKQFKAITWVEITDKKEIEKVLYNAYSLEDARYGRLNSPSHERDWIPKKQNIFSGKTHLYFYSFDFERDGENEIIYKQTIPYPRGPEKNGCGLISDHTVFDKKISIDNVINKPLDNYSRLGLDGSDFLFLFNNEVINSLWNHYGDQYSIELWSINHYEALCKINVQ